MNAHIMSSVETLAHHAIITKRAELAAAAEFAQWRDQLLAAGFDSVIVTSDGSIAYRAECSRESVDGAALRKRLDKASKALAKLAVACPGYAADILAVQSLLSVPTRASTVKATVAVKVAP